MGGTVLHPDEVQEERAPGDSAAVRALAGPATGSEHLAQRLVRFAPGRSRPRGPGPHEEVLFVLEGSGTLRLDGREHALEADAGVLVRPGEEYEVQTAKGVTVSSVTVLTPPEAAVDAGERRVVVRPGGAEAATAQREFRVVNDPATGCRGVTQFVGWIPPGRAPEHFHEYDEVVLVLDGEGVAHLQGEADAPLRPRSCVHLPARLRHSIENMGEGPMRVLGVFRPAGSPSAAFYPDGTPAMGGSA